MVTDAQDCKVQLGFTQEKQEMVAGCVLGVCRASSFGDFALNIRRLGGLRT